MVKWARGERRPLPGAPRPPKRRPVEALLALALIFLVAATLPRAAADPAPRPGQGLCHCLFPPSLIGLQEVLNLKITCFLKISLLSILKIIISFSVYLKVS